METEKIISYFKELSTIPRQSGDEKAVSDYLIKFAKELGLWAKQDEDYNVLVKKPATEGMENYFAGTYGYGVCCRTGNRALLSRWD